MITTKGTRVPSRGPDKQKVSDALKREGRCSKVTQIRSHGDGKFSGRCFRRVELIWWEWRDIGRYWVQFDIMRDGSLGQHINGGELHD